MSGENPSGAMRYMPNMRRGRMALPTPSRPLTYMNRTSVQMADLCTPQLRPFVTAKCRIGHARERAFECAWALQDRAEDLTTEQHIACIVAVMRGPDRADFGCIALAAQVFGQRQ